MSLRGELADVAQRWAEVACNRPQVVEDGSGVFRKALQAVQRQAALVLEGGEDLEGVGERLALRRESAEGPVGADDRARQSLVMSGQGTEDVAGVVDEGPERLLLASEGAEDVARVRGERAEVAEGVIQVEASAVDRQGAVLHPGLERLSGGPVEALEDLVDLGLVLDLRLGEVTALGDRMRSVAARDLTGVDGARLGGRLRGVLDRGDVGLSRLDLATGVSSI